jgi:hypothetical protein
MNIKYESNNKKSIQEIISFKKSVNHLLKSK